MSANKTSGKSVKKKLANKVTIESGPATKPSVKKARAKSGAKKSPLLDDGPINPRPAFREFSLEDEWYGRRRMRSLGKCINSAKHAPNASHEIFSTYRAALGNSKTQWFSCNNQAGDIVHREKYIQPTQEQAARDLYTIAYDATVLLGLLLEREPELCKLIAATKPAWPVVADLTEKDWQRHAAEMIDRLGLGRDIKGYLLAARTADQNVIRCWATAIYQTLFQTRFDFKRAIEEPSKYRTTEGCPAWARRTLELPRFTKANSRLWAKLGEEMLLEQVPDFLASPDLVEKKGSWTLRAERSSRSGKASIRAIHRQAFEDFAKEMKNIAPEREIWRGTW
ncbi:MAG: hypothetical protein J0M04_14690 [Verrucomicrobia bacterium]|nr:hypothetical protein [Verrucomicrobiota bacterium]